MPNPTRLRSPAVDAYIRAAPALHRSKLRIVRRAIRDTVPDAVEVVSYWMPGFSYPGYPYQGMIAWFSLRSGYVSLTLRLPTIQDHRRELARFVTTKSAVHFPLDEPIPVSLVKSLVRASAQVVRGRVRSTGSRTRSRPRESAFRSR